MFDEHQDQIGPNKQFKNKKALWHYVASELFEVLGVNRTFEQLNNRYKTVIRKRRAKIKRDAVFPTYDEPITRPPVAKSTPEIPSESPSTVYEPPTWQLTVARTIRDTLLEIDTRRAARELKKEQARQRRHDDIVKLLKSLS